jgi:hypothetical protein
MAYRNNSSKFWTGFLAVLLVLVIAGTAALVGVLSDGFKNWDKFKPDEEQTEQTEETADNGGAIIGESVGSGVKVMSAKIAPENYAANGVSAQAETAYTLTATVLPEKASNKAVDWAVSFVNPSSAWATGKTVTDYVTVTPTADGALTANVECLQAFGEQIKVTVTSRNNAEATATCLVDYAERVAGYTLTLTNGGVTISSSDPEYTVTGNSSVSISKGEYTKTVGTIEENFTGTYVIRGNASFAANMSSIGVNATVKQVSGSVVPVGEDIFTSLYQLSPQGGTPFPSTNQLMDYANSHTDIPFAEVYVHLEGEHSDYTCTFSLYGSSGIFTYEVESVSLNQSQIIF